MFCGVSFSWCLVSLLDIRGKLFDFEGGGCLRISMTSLSSVESSGARRPCVKQLLFRTVHKCYSIQVYVCSRLFIVYQTKSTTRGGGGGGSGGGRGRGVFFPVEKRCII